MPLFDAINPAMSTMASGVFSTKNTSIGFWNHMPQIQYITIFFMILAGSNFVLLYYAIKGEVKRGFADTEFSWYTGFIAGCAFLVMGSMLR